MRGGLADQIDGRPALIWFDSCQAAIRTIPMLIYDDLHVEDIAEGPCVEDHASDETRYFVMHVGSRPMGGPSL